MTPASRPETLTEKYKLAFLKGIELFTEMRETDLVILAQDFRPSEYKRGDVLFEQGQTDQAVFVVVEGKVRIFKLSLAGNETSISIASRGAVIGEFAAIDAGLRSATAKALDACLLLRMPGERFMRHMRLMPGLALGMSRILVSKLRLTATYAEAVAQYDAAGRLLHILLLYNNEFGHALEPGKRYVLDLNLSQADLASLVGARREHINRILRDWHKRGLIEYKNGEIIFLDLPAVQQEYTHRMEASRVALSG